MSVSAVLDTVAEDLEAPAAATGDTNPGAELGDTNPGAELGDTNPGDETGEAPASGDDLGNSAAELGND
jgi:hypothetical protein